MSSETGKLAIKDYDTIKENLEHYDVWNPNKVALKYALEVEES
jgi:hypothetical protein